jgi:hypothetical protein
LKGGHFAIIKFPPPVKGDKGQGGLMGKTISHIQGIKELKGFAWKLGNSLHTAKQLL